MNDAIVLYVDDERANRIVFEQTFQQRFHLRCVASGDEALAVLKEGNIAVLVTDQRMPGMSGHELLEKTRALYPEVTRVILTAYGDVDPILRAVNDGLVARYLVKPWDRAELEQVLTWAIDAHALSRSDASLLLRLMQTERLVTIGSISAAVMHDLQQPLASMRLNLSRLHQHAELIGETRTSSSAAAVKAVQLGAALDELPELVQDLGLAADVMQGIVDHLRSFLRPDQASARAEAHAARATVGVDPLPIIRYASGICRQIAANMRGHITYDGAAELPRVQMGSTELTQVLINLISNAANALKPEGRVLVSANATPEGVRFVISDNGAGMSPDVLRKAGRPFFSTRTLGTGLGLSQCHRLLGLYGSHLELESTVGTGTLARFTLPLAH